MDWFAEVLYLFENVDASLWDQGLKSTLHFDFEERSICCKDVVAHDFTVRLLHDSQLFAPLNTPEHEYLRRKSHLYVPRGQP